MRFGLNKTQIKMLLDGKCLKDKRRAFQLPSGEGELRSVLENYMGDPEMQANCRVIFDTDQLGVSVERKTK